MLQLVVAGSTGVLWVFTLYKLLPLYRSGAIQGQYRGVFRFVLFALSWVTMQIIVWLFMHQDAAAMMFNALWAMVGLAWAILATVGRTRRNVFEARAQEAPRPVQQGKQSRPDISGYTVRTAPRQAHGGVRAASGQRSARVRRIMGMGESYGD